MHSGNSVEMTAFDRAFELRIRRARNYKSKADRIPPGEVFELTPPDRAMNPFEYIWTQPLDGGAPYEVRRFTSQTIMNFDWSEDWRLVCS